MSLNHLLSLSALHAVSPGVLDVVFGADGEFPDAPRWTASIWGSVTRWGEDRPSSFVARWTRSGADFVTPEWDGNAGVRAPSLDLRVRSVAQRLAALCCRAADPRKDIHTWQRAADLADRAARCEWLDDYAATLASLTLSLAPQIAALKGTP